MKVLMYGWEFPPYISGGLGVVCYELTNALTKLDVDINFILPVLKQGVSRQDKINLIGTNQVFDDLDVETIQKLNKNFKFKTIDSSLRPYINDIMYKEFLNQIKKIETIYKKEKIANSYNVNFSGDYGENLMDEVERYSKIAGHIAKKIEHDIIHVHDWMTMLAGIEAKKNSGKPLLVHIHALEKDRSGENVNQFVYDIERYGMQMADKVIAVSYYTKQCIVKYYGIDEDKILVVHNAVSRQEIRDELKTEKNDQEKVVLFLGRITFQKGPDYFVEAAGKVIKMRPNVKFVMAGSGDMAHRMIERVAKLGIGRNFHFTGFLNRAEVEKMFSLSDIYVMSSVSEPFGISCLEAMIYDIPVIVSKQSGVTEVLDHALKVDFWDTDELANKILALLDYPQLSQEMLKHAKQELKKFQWEKTAEHMLEIYKSFQ